MVTAPCLVSPVGFHLTWVCGKALGWTNRDKTRTKPAPTPRLPASAGEPIFFLFLLLPDYSL